MLHLSGYLIRILTIGLRKGAGDRQIVALADAIHPGALFPLHTKSEMVLRPVPAVLSKDALHLHDRRQRY